MPSVNIRDPFNEAAYYKGWLSRAPLGRRYLNRVPWYVLLGGVLALAALLKG